MRTGALPIKFDLTPVLARAHRLPLNERTGVELTLPYITRRVSVTDTERRVAREVIIRMRDRRILSASECCDNCIDNAISSLTEIRRQLTDSQVELASIADGPLFLMLDAMSTGIRQFMTFEERLRTVEELPDAPTDFRRDAVARQGYFDGLEELRAHLARCLREVARIGNTSGISDGLVGQYGGPWPLEAYLPPVAGSDGTADGPAMDLPGSPDPASVVIMVTTAQVNKVLRLIAERHVETGETVTGRYVRRKLKDFDPELVDAALAACVPDLLRRVGKPPGASYGLRAAALERVGPVGSRVALFIEQMLRFFAAKDDVDPDFRDYNWGEVSQALGLDAEADYTFAVAALWMGELTNGGNLSPSTHKFTFGVPEDVEAILRCETFDAYLAVRADVTSRPADVMPPADTLTEEKSVAPKMFMSYSWDSDDHKDWVKTLAKRLREDEVEVILDQWEVALGDQIPHFMETAVRDSDFVLMVCTANYKIKADGRTGGVGYEGNVITGEVFSGTSQRKFIPAWRAATWEDAAPSWLTGKSRLDLRGDPYSEAEYAKLLAHLHGEREAAPPLGRRRKKPSRSRSTPDTDDDSDGPPVGSTGVLVSKYMVERPEPKLDRKKRLGEAQRLRGSKGLQPEDLRPHFVVMEVPRPRVKFKGLDAGMMHFEVEGRSVNIPQADARSWPEANGSFAFQFDGVVWCPRDITGWLEYRPSSR